MQLALSSVAAPDATLTELLAACTRRGLAGVELVDGDGHGVGGQPDAASIGAWRGLTREAGVRVCGIYRDTLKRDELDQATRLAGSLDAPLIVPLHGIEPEIIAAAAAAAATRGSRLLLGHGTDIRETEELRLIIKRLPQPHSVGMTWQVRPEQDDPLLAEAVISAAGPLLRYVRLHGGGPESSLQTGRGVGALMARLALGRYGGPLVIAPSSSRYSYIWRAWLGRAGGWGCGSRQSDPALVTL